MNKEAAENMMGIATASAMLGILVTILITILRPDKKKVEETAEEK